MAVREASIRVGMKNAGFLSGLREMGDKVNAAGTRMGAAIAKPMKAGIDSAKGAFGDLMGSMKDHMKTVATLGGAFALGSFVKDALGDQSTYRDVAYEVGKVSKEFQSWEDIFNLVDPIGDAVGQTGDKMAAAFKQVYTATGDVEYSKGVLETIGAAATASGRDISEYAQLAQLAYRKFGASSEELQQYIAQIDSQLGSGGAALEDLGDKFGMMATEAVEAGLTGASGMSTLLGAMKAVDKEVGEKAPGAFKAMFASLKNNTGAMEALQKAAGMKFSPDMDAFEKIKAMLSTDKGRKAMELSFKGDSRVLFDSLVKPFDAAVKKSKEAGKSQKDATKDGLTAFDQFLGKMGDSTATYTGLMDRVNDRMKNDPTVVFKMALEKMSGAFADPRMFKAIEKMAKTLPVVADYFVKFVDFAANHPFLTMGGLAGAKVGLAFTQGALTDAGGSIGRAAMAKLGPLLTSNAFSAGTVMGGAAKVALVAGAAFIGFELGKYIAESFWENKEKAEKDAKAAEIQGFNAEQGGDLKAKGDALAAIRENILKLQEAQGGIGEWYENASAALANQIDPSVGYVDTRSDQIAKLEAQERALMESVKAQEEANKKSTSTTKAASEQLVQFGQAASDAAKVLQGLAPNSNAPHLPGGLPVTPGHGGI